MTARTVVARNRFMGEPLWEDRRREFRGLQRRIVGATNERGQTKKKMTNMVEAGIQNSKREINQIWTCPGNRLRGHQAYPPL